jgi:hypothetical protein
MGIFLITCFRVLVYACSVSGGFFCRGGCFVNVRGGMATYRYPDCTVFFLCMYGCGACRVGVCMLLNGCLHLTVFPDVFINSVCK